MRSRRPFRPLPLVLSCLVALSLVALGGALPALADDSASSAARAEHAETRELISLVTDAAAIVAERGVEPACEGFREKGSRWLDGETYVFVLAIDGKALCHPGRPSLEGRALVDLRDPHGKPIVQNFIRDLADSEESWEHYLWPRPGGGTNFFWKTSYIRRVTGPDGADYMVGSGRYQMPMERFFIVEQVDDACELIEREDEASFSTLRDRSSGFRFYDSYVFVMTWDGVHLVNPAFPDNEGENLLDLEDSSGKVIGREMLALLEDQESGWVDYTWPRPGDQRVSEKSSYVRKVTLDDGRNVVVGAGLYVSAEPLPLPEPEDAGRPEDAEPAATPASSSGS